MSYDVRDFGAQGDGSTDDTVAFQEALAAAANDGGGVVFAPAGSYRIDGTLNLGTSVILRGEWKAPTESDPRVVGTVLQAYAGRGQEEGTPFLAVGAGGGVLDLSIVYPEQRVDDIQPYPFTIRQAGYQVATVMNVTLVNPYQAMDFGDPNEMHYVRNVYGTPLKLGIAMDEVYDVGRLIEVHFAPRYWAGSGLVNAPAEEDVAALLRADPGATGIEVGLSDWEVIAAVSIEDYAEGIRFVQGRLSPGGCNGGIYDLRIRGARTGLRFDFINPYGWSISASTIEATAGEDPVGVRAAERFEDVSVQFNQTSFAGTGRAIVLPDGSDGLVSCTNCAFTSWGANSHAVDVRGGAVTLQGCDFTAASMDGGDEEPRHLNLADGVSAAVVLGNTFAARPRIDVADPDNDQIRIDHDADAYDFPSIAAEPYEFAVHPRPAGDLVLDVTTQPYGAAADGETDDTDAIQRALDDAGRDGGGTVYLPAGRYRVDGRLTVPGGVELRGIHDVPHHTSNEGSVLLAYLVERGESDPERHPFVILESHHRRGGSGLRGLLIWFPEQQWDDIQPQPWAVQSRGPGNWLIYTVVSNAYRAVDFGTFNNDGMVIDYLGGAALRTGLFVGNAPTNAWIENVHFNPHFWSRSNDLPGAPGVSELDIWPWQLENGTAFIFGYLNQPNIMGTFVFGARDGVRFVSQQRGHGRTQGAFSGEIIGHGTDGALIGARVSAVGDGGLDLVNYQAVQFEDGHFAVLEESLDDAAVVRFVNTNHWTDPSVGFVLAGGDVLLQQTHFTHGGGVGLEVTGGTATIQNAFFQEVMDDAHVVAAGGDVSVLGSVAADGLTTSGEVAEVHNVAR